MIDCSRNVVMTVPQLKHFFSIIAKMGYNQAMLYMEDTYEIENEKFFGYLRGKYNFKPYMWNAMFYRLASGGSYYATDVTFDPSIKEKVPEGVTLVYWDYYHTNKKTYESKDMQAIGAIVGDYKKLFKNTESFYYAFRNQWYTDNKPHGFDVQDIRLGGLITQLKSCCDRLKDYRDDKIDSIGELEETLIPVYNKDVRFNIWQSTVTVNSL